MAAHPADQRLSVNALLLTPTRIRLQALWALWRHRSCWRLPALKANMRSERDREIAETIPIVLILAFIAAGLIFVVIPGSLREQAEVILANLWPTWVVQAAPMVVAQTLAMLNAPAIALRYVELDAQGYFPQERQARERKLASLAVPQVVAHAALCVVCSCLMVAFSLLFGLLLEFVLAVGDIRTVFDTVLASTSPLAWLRSLFQAAVLGAVCAASAALFAWPLSHRIQTAQDSHKLGMQAMVVASAACALAGLGMIWVANLLGWRPEAIAGL
jgi:hypothetical protein